MAIYDSYNSNFLTQSREKDQYLGYILGFLGVCCFLLASFLLIKLSLQNSWLTPIRQYFMLSIFSFTLIFVPFFSSSKKRKYFSMLPAVGTTILHFATYGAVFYHYLIKDSIGLMCVTLIGAVSLFLFVKTKTRAHAFLAILGSYFGLLFFYTPEYLYYLGAMSFIWAGVFSYYAVVLKDYDIMFFAAFLGLIVFCIVEFTDSKAILIQTVQFLIFFSGILIFSIKNNKKLSKLLFMSLLLFFHQIQYSHLAINKITLLNVSFKSYFFSLFFILFLLFIDYLIKRELKIKIFKGIDLVYTACALIFSLFLFPEMTCLFQHLVSFLILILFLLIANFNFCEEKKQAQISINEFNGTIFVLSMLILLNFALVLFNQTELGVIKEVYFGIIYGTLFLILSNFLSPTQFSNFVSKFFKYSHFIIIFNLGHLGIFISLCRGYEYYFGFSGLSPFAITYAFFILLWGYRKKEIDGAKIGIILILASLLHFFYRDFIFLGEANKIISLFFMGLLIYMGGYLYTQTCQHHRLCKS